MITTPQLIDSLVTGAAPVRRLRAPLVRALGWLAIAGAIVTLLAVSHGLRPDLGAKLAQPGFMTGVAASLITAVLAAVAAFHVSLPDRSRAWLLLPLPSLAVWVSSIGYQCLSDWIAIRAGGVRTGELVDCFATLALTSVPLWLAMLVMLRHSALLRSTPAAFAASLAVAAVAASALLLFHPLDASAMVLIWNLGTALVVIGLGSLAWGRLLPRLALR